MKFLKNKSICNVIVILLLFNPTTFYHEQEFVYFITSTYKPIQLFINNVISFQYL